MNANLKALAVTALLTACLGGQTGHAGPVGPLTTFVAGTTAKASEVNANFSAVSTAVNDNASRIGTLETTITPAGNIVLAPSTTTTGNIFKGTAPFIHNFGSLNTFIGEDAGNFTMATGGLGNTAIGARALQNNTTGYDNTAIGVGALNSNTDGIFNTAIGANVFFRNTTGSGNTATGEQVLPQNTTGNFNTASGHEALFNNTTGNFNTASGVAALQDNTTGSNNIALGFGAGFLLTTGDFNIMIGHGGVAAEGNTTRIGRDQTRTFISGIRGVTTASATAIPVLIDTNGQLGTASSSRRVKEDIAAMGEASGALMKLRPVTFHYKSDNDPNGRTLQYGLVAEEVAEVAPGLAAHSADGKIETVYYQFLAPMLLNEYQKQQRTIQAQAADLAKQKLEIAELRQQTARIAELEKQTGRMATLLGRLEQNAMIATAGR
jgi:hypothetical protein